jgi:NAD(P)-dependent dehydrogenase (short-subunit alcohol dehydrogenase family)
MIKDRKTCLITGATGGIGYALVKVFSAAGYYVVATDCVDKPDALYCDSYLEIDLNRFVEDEAYADISIHNVRNVIPNKRLDVLLNNAAIQILGGVETLSRSQWRTTLDVNLLAPFLLTQALIEELKSGQGGVINIGSIHARLTKKNFIAYATSKAALTGMTRAMAADLGPRVRINCIEPAAIETDMLKAGFEGKAELYAQLENCHPIQRIGQPEEVARLALAITAEGMDFLHGAIIGLDGGIGGLLSDPSQGKGLSIR